MRMLQTFKARYPKLFPVLAAVVALSAVGGAALYERTARASGDCCYPGAPCCHPGAACCNKHKAKGEVAHQAVAH